MEATLDATDPLVIFTTWALTQIVGNLFDLTERPKLRVALPAIAVLIAVLIRVTGATWTEGWAEGFAWPVLWCGLVDGAIAVLGHSQLREVLKLVKPGEESKAATKLMLYLFLLGGVATTLPACGLTVVRRADVYTTQVRWLEARNTETVSTLYTLAELAENRGDLATCELAAERALIGDYATTWRLQAMLWQVGKADDPGEAPSIPSVDSVCEVTP